ncbi:MAG TPA: hypothetical protein DIU15_02995 [Deltaproteobacteria bacterium]|nr:hypothetical protein [Deltaproteobacteria bacterium]HCP44977.1 hypothetical protein [Deltaproteobacteria bacterium]
MYTSTVETVAPLFTALIALSMAISTLIRGARDRLHQEYAFLAGVISIVFLCLFFLIMSKEEAWRYGLLASALLVAPASLQVYGQVLRRHHPPFLHFVPILYVLAAIQIVAIAVLGANGYIVISNGILVFGGLATQVFWIHRLAKKLDRAVERARVTNLLWVGSVAVLAMGIEMAFLDWNFWRAPEAGSRVFFPPIGSMATAGYIYFLGQIILRHRLLERDEIVARIVVSIGMVVLLAGVYGVLVRLIGPRTGMVAEAVDILIASTLVLILYEPLKIAMEKYVQRSFSRERYEYGQALELTLRQLPSIIELEPLLNRLFDGALSTGRVDLASLYLYDEARAGYRLRRWEGDPEHSLLPAVPQRPFIDGLLDGRSHYLLEELEAETVGQAAAVLPPWLEGTVATMQSLQTELCLPLRIGPTVIGLWNLRTRPGSHSFSDEEVHRLTDLADLCAVLIDNSRAFERMKERDRLATLGQMAAGLAHEIRNPLGAIKGATQLLHRSGRDSDSEFLGIIVEEVNRLDGVVQEFLDYARPMKMRVDPIHPDLLIHGVVAMAEAQGLPENVVVEYVSGQNVPELPMDIEKLKQVALNLLLNGIESMAKRGGRLMISTHVRHTDLPDSGITSLRSRAPGTGNEVRVKRGSVATPSYVEIAFDDEGEGIRPEDVRKLFIPFFTTKAEGTGLGLPICERIMRAHGGAMEIESVLGEGTRFTLRLPLPESRDDSQEGREAEEHEPDQTPNDSDKRTLTKDEASAPSDEQSA